jgi:hypothetical protein
MVLKDSDSDLPPTGCCSKEKNHNILGIDGCLTIFWKTNNSFFNLTEIKISIICVKIPL